MVLSKALLGLGLMQCDLCRDVFEPHHASAVPRAPFAASTFCLHLLGLWVQFCKICRQHPSQLS